MWLLRYRLVNVTIEEIIWIDGLCIMSLFIVLILIRNHLSLYVNSKIAYPIFARRWQFVFFAVTCVSEPVEKLFYFLYIVIDRISDNYTNYRQKWFVMSFMFSIIVSIIWWYDLNIWSISVSAISVENSIFSIEEHASHLLFVTEIRAFKECDCA